MMEQWGDCNGREEGDRLHGVVVYRQGWTPLPCSDISDESVVAPEKF